MTDESGFKGYVYPENVWEVFDKNKTRLLKEIVTIAENEDTGYSLAITIDGEERLVSLYRDGKKEKEEAVISKADCTDTVCYYIDQYLLPVYYYNDYKGIADDETKDEEVDAAQAEEDAIAEREDELRLAVLDFIDVAIGDKSADKWIDLLRDDDIADILEVFTEYLFTEYGLPVSRMVSETESDKDDSR